MARRWARAVFAILLLALVGGAVGLRLASRSRGIGGGVPSPVAESALAPRWIPPSPAGMGFGRSPHDPPEALTDAGLDRSLRRLTRRLADDPDDVPARSNLAAVLIARAGRTGREADLLVAYREIRAVAEAAPGVEEALYNRAVVLDRLGLRGPAAAAWRDWMSSAGESGEGLVARRITELDRPPLFDSWETEGRGLLLAAALGARAADLRRVARTFRPFVRQWVEEVVLPCWAGGDPDRRKLVLRGLRRYGRGLEIHRSFGDVEEKERWLAGAENDLGNSRAPLWRWARLYRAGGWARDRPALAQDRLARLAAGTSADRQPALLARIHWSMGINEVTRNRFEDVLPHYERTRELLLRSEGPGSAAFADLLIAEAWSRLGAVDEAWAHRIAALQRGRLLASRGEVDEAEASFERARLAAARIAEEPLRRRTESTLALYRAEAMLDTGGEAGMIRLEKAITDIPIYPIATIATVDAAKDVLIVGYGHNVQAAFGIMEKRKADVHVRPDRVEESGAFEKQEIVVGDPLVDDAPGLPKDACEQDSGGPVLLRVGGRWQLVALISRSAGGRCGNGSICVRLDHHTTWIDKTIDALGGQKRPEP